jgi:glucose-6-phosphate isomerase
VLALQGEILGLLHSQNDRTFTCEECATALGRPEEVETVFNILKHLAANPDHGVSVAKSAAQPWESKYRMSVAG